MLRSGTGWPSHALTNVRLTLDCQDRGADLLVATPNEYVPPMSIGPRTSSTVSFAACHFCVSSVVRMSLRTMGLQSIHVSAFGNGILLVVAVGAFKEVPGADTGGVITFMANEQRWFNPIKEIPHKAMGHPSLSVNPHMPVSTISAGACPFPAVVTKLHLLPELVDAINHCPSPKPLKRQPHLVLRNTNHGLHCRLG